MNTSLITVLSDDQTYAEIEETMIVAIPGSIQGDDDTKAFLKEGEYEHFTLGEVKDSDTILRFFRLFFPDMQVEEDNSGQVIIYTGIFEGEDTTEDFD